MDTIPNSIVAAIACSAAAGKNPWIPLGLICLVGGAPDLPDMLVNNDLQGGLHAMAPPSVMLTLGTIFCVLAILDSLADKLPFVQEWLVPVSTAWRPFAGVAVAGLVGSAGLMGSQEIEAPVATASFALGTFGLTVLLGSFSGYVATVAKTAVRLVLSVVPVPFLKFTHSLFDDCFAAVATVVGIALAGNSLVTVLAFLYVLVGLLTAPFLGRLAWIHFRIAWHAFAKVSGVKDRHNVPGWLKKWIEAEELDDAKALRAYSYHAPNVGRVREGYLVFANGSVSFVSRRFFFGPRVWHVPFERLTRIGLSQSLTEQLLMVHERTESGAIREACIRFFPAKEADVRTLVDEGALEAGAVRVNVTSESARRGQGGYADAGKSVRFLPAEKSGDLRIQAVVTIAAAVLGGLLTAGHFIPIGAGYFLSPFTRRGVFGAFITLYLTLCIVVSAWFAWPAAVAYAVVLNALVLRDLARQSLKAKLDGYVDKRAFLPPVCQMVWVPKTAVQDPNDTEIDEAIEVPVGASWKRVLEFAAPIGNAAPAR